MLDALLEREPFFRDAKALLKTIENQQIQGFITATTLTDIFYIARTAKGIEIAFAGCFRSPGTHANL